MCFLEKAPLTQGLTLQHLFVAITKLFNDNFMNSKIDTIKKGLDKLFLKCSF